MDVADSGGTPETRADATGPDGSTLWYAALGYLIDEVVFIHREDRTIAFVSPSVTSVLGYTPDEFTELSTPELIHPDDLPAAAEQAVALRAEPGTSYRSILRIRHADGRWIWAEVVGRNLLHEPSVRGVVQTLRDISERRALEEELERRAHTDGLTGIANRNRVLDELAQALADARDGIDAEVAVLYLDLDGFKAINDTHGHLVGDAVLQVVADRLGDAVRHGDVVGRLGGDEFLAVLRDQPDEPAASAAAHRVLAGVCGPVSVGAVDVQVRASVGVARARPGDDPDHLVSRADRALYAAKRAGGARVAQAEDGPTAPHDGRA